MRADSPATVASAIALCGLLLASPVAASAESKEQTMQYRGYYITLMRMPLMGLPEWKDAVECFQEDGANTLILWMGGGFRSKTYPVTWQYNREHKNVQQDFVRELIDYAHGKGVRVLLAITPFGYDGVNRYTEEHPELRAVRADGRPNDAFGIHCWGVNLCPSRAESQRFMLEYTRELLFQFYPNADGLMIESSDYAVCQCDGCRGHFFEKEFAFTRRISDELWQRNPQATILVYPHYFTGADVKLPGFFETKAAALPFDPRWTLFFTPHSAHIDEGLLRRAPASVWWNDAPALGDALGHPRRRPQSPAARHQRVSALHGGIQLANGARGVWRPASGRPATQAIRTRLAGRRRQPLSPTARQGPAAGLPRVRPPPGTER